MSKRHTFHLQPILNYKTSVVDSLEVEFAHLKTAHENEADSLRKLQVVKQQGMAALQQQQLEDLLDCRTIQLHQQYLQALEENLAQQAARVAAIKGQMETKRDELIESMQGQETLEKLREQSRAEQQQELLRSEARTVDDLVITRYSNKR